MNTYTYDLYYYYYFLISTTDCIRKELLQGTPHFHFKSKTTMMKFLFNYLIYITNNYLIFDYKDLHNK